jgi:hypothetical protein
MSKENNDIDIKRIIIYLIWAIGISVFLGIISYLIWRALILYNAISII